MYPKNLKYTGTHEWVGVDKDIATVGITDFATKQLTDLVYVELPSIGAKVTKGSSFGVVESVKAVSDLHSPLSGKVVKVNENLSKEPEIITQDPYGKGWMIKVKIEGRTELDSLMGSEEYEELVRKEKQ
ncbi:MAG: glycine cleavage system protein GcvH [bacterium]